MRICFFAKVRDKALFNVVEFYKVDIDALRQLGHEVVCVNSFKELMLVRCDLYYIWWFGYGVFPALLAKLKGKPTILTGAVHTNDCGGLSDWPLYKRSLMMLAMKLVDRNLFISRTDFAKLGSFRPSSFEIAYCAVDVGIYTPDNAGPRRDLIVTITHLTKENVARKMLMQSIEAFALFSRQHPTYKYHICGSFGDAVDDVRAKIQECGIEDKVDLRGRISDEDKLAVLRCARAYLQPSTCEGFGLAILEAKACGTPVVTNSEPCIVEINGDSVLYGESIQEWSAGLARLSDDSKFFDEMQLKGLENVNRYTAVARRAVIDKVIGSLGI
ncbi:MAG: hypothetical protein C0406_02330 [Sideroxydans sp.]|nr:hypothetical protein [Sideroxydans sp.]